MRTWTLVIDSAPLKSSVFGRFLKIRRVLGPLGVRGSDQRPETRDKRQEPRDKRQEARPGGRSLDLHTLHFQNLITIVTMALIDDGVNNESN